MNYKRGFTLIELLVVVGIIAVMASLTLGYLSSARKKGNDTAVKSNTQTVRALSEIFYLDNSASYLPAGGSNFAPATCPSYNAAGTNMFAINSKISAALTEAVARGNGSSSCANSSSAWAIAIGLNLDATKSWCIDNSGRATVVSFIPSAAINSSTYLCN